MYTIPENLDGTEFNGWINQDLLLKDSRRSSASRKRGYELSNVDLDYQCEDLRARVLRPRHNPEPLASPSASRTRPIRSNRTRRLPITPPIENTPQTLQPLPPDIQATSSANDLSLLQALMPYSWPSNYLIAQNDPSILNRPHQNPYSSIPGPGIQNFDPWVLHNYMIASSGYNPITPSHLTQESQHDNTRGYPSMMPENIALNHNLVWHYPFFLSPLPPNQSTTRPPELGLHVPSHHSYESHPDLSHLFRPTNGAFSYGSLCPYHNINHIIHHNHSTHASSSHLPEPPLQQHLPFHSYGYYSDIAAHSGHFWHPITPNLRSVNHPMSSSNIDTLLHLAAHFEQRKRGITKEELDKLPTHRHKNLSTEKIKKDKISSDDCKHTTVEDLEKCLVCLDDFEPKQSIRTLQCSHEFHAKCIDKWLKINRTCPLCRADATEGASRKDGRAC